MGKTGQEDKRDIPGLGKVFGVLQTIECAGQFNIHEHPVCVFALEQGNVRCTGIPSPPSSFHITLSHSLKILDSFQGRFIDFLITAWPDSQNVYDNLGLPCLIYYSEIPNP